MLLLVITDLDKNFSLGLIDVCRQEGKAVILLHIRRKALELAKEPPHFSIPDGLFKASAIHVWRHPIMKKHDLYLRCRTTLAQRLPKDLEPKLSGFHKLIVLSKKKKKERNCHIFQIGNIDETPLRYDMPYGSICIKELNSHRRKRLFA